MQTQQNTFKVEKNQFQSAFIISLISLFLNIILFFVSAFTLDMEELLGGITIPLLIISSIISLVGVVSYSKDMVSTKPSKMFLCLYFFNFVTFLIAFLTIAPLAAFDIEIQYTDEWGWQEYRWEFQTTALIIWILYICYMIVNLVIYCKVASKIKNQYQIFQKQNLFLTPINNNNNQNYNQNNNGQQYLQQGLQQYQAPIEGIPLQIEQRPASLVVQGQAFTQNQIQQYQQQQPQQYVMTANYNQNNNFQNYQQ